MLFLLWTNRQRDRTLVDPMLGSGLPVTGRMDKVKVRQELIDIFWMSPVPN